MAVKRIGLNFEKFLKWLEKRCRTVYCTANLGHRGPGIKATYKYGNLYLEWGVRGGHGSLNNEAIKVIFTQYNQLKSQRINAGKYAWGVFRQCPNRTMAPYVPALIRDYEFELYVGRNSK